MKIGMVLSCWMDRLTEQLALYREAGFDGVEVRMTEEGQRVAGALRVDRVEEDARELAEAAAAAGIEVHSIMCSPLWRYPLTSPDESVRRMGLRIVERALAAAEVLGATAVLVVPGLVTEEVGYEEAINRARESIGELLAHAEDRGVILAVENVGNRLLLSPLEMRGFVDSFNSDYVRAYFDVGNVLLLRQGYPQDWIRILGRRIAKVHMKDYDSRTGGVTYLLQGDVNWLEVMRALREIGYDDYLTAELPPYRLFPEKMLRDTASALRLLTSAAP
ncbi:MAG: sugar phosphate isomerase/epimerase [Thermoprotei archaeon]|nr:MAG: sugar phosphate isomerase/epimerase [Thermoprotei archaeon]